LRETNVRTKTIRGVGGKKERTKTRIKEKKWRQGIVGWKKEWKGRETERETASAKKGFGENYFLNGFLSR
jgi:hypothetical protein